MLWCGQELLANWLLNHISSLVCLWFVEVIWSYSHTNSRTWLCGSSNQCLLAAGWGTGHYAAYVHVFRNSKFPLRIGQHGPQIWPPKSPDLTMWDMWLWSFTTGWRSTIHTHSVAKLKGKIQCDLNIITLVPTQWFSFGDKFNYE
jgi:hypothetical protein